MFALAILGWLTAFILCCVASNYRQQLRFVERQADNFNQLAREFRGHAYSWMRLAKSRGITKGPEIPNFPAPKFFN
jgi:hypothetical protein